MCHCLYARRVVKGLALADSHNAVISAGNQLFD